MSSIRINKKAGNKSIVIFGAGKIGRSFIGQLFGRSGYEVIFVDIDPVIVAALNQYRNYTVMIKGETEEKILVSNVRFRQLKDLYLKIISRHGSTVKPLFITSDIPPWLIMVF